VRAFGSHLADIPLAHHAVLGGGGEKRARGGTYPRQAVHAATLPLKRAHFFEADVIKERHVAAVKGDKDVVVGQGVPLQVEHALADAVLGSLAAPALSGGSVVKGH